MNIRPPRRLKFSLFLTLTRTTKSFAVVTRWLCSSDSLLKRRMNYGQKMQLNTWSSHFFHGAVIIYICFSQFDWNKLMLLFCLHIARSIHVTMFLFLFFFVFFAIESLFIISCCSDECYVSSSLNLRWTDLYVLATQSIYYRLAMKPKPAHMSPRPSIESVHKFSSMDLVVLSGEALKQAIINEDKLIAKQKRFM
jgi:hypothetical protein